MTFSTVGGFFACFVSSVFFGSMFVPLKRHYTGDGMFVQWVMGCAIFCTGLIVGAYDGYQKFYPFAMLGGLLWATGNITAIPIINRIGMTIGMLLWSFTGLISGWASGRYGWFGIKPSKPEDDFLNITGLIFSLVSTIMFAFVKNEPPKADRNNQTATNGVAHTFNESDDSLIQDDVSDNDELLGNERRNSGVQPCSKNQVLIIYNRHRQRFLAIIGACLAGCFYGLCFVPVNYIVDNVPNASQEALSYVFSFSCGVFVSCTGYFIIYASYKGNNPDLYPKTALPAFLAGILWAIAQTAFFVANESLSEAVSFPIISRFPGLIAALWGVFLFKEIKGRNNLIILGCAMIVTVIGGVLCGLSKIM